MQTTNINNNLNSKLFGSDKLKCIEINKYNSNEANSKNFLNGLKNARNILEDLEKSIKKTNQYEKRLLKCKSTHAHSHENEWKKKNVDVSKVKEEPKKDDNAASRLPRSRVDLTESWSTMSIVCLQYQYEELSKRYESLLQAYNESCSSLNERRNMVEHLRRKCDSTNTELQSANIALNNVCEMYLTLLDKRSEQKERYKDKIREMKDNLNEVLLIAEEARLDLDAELSRKMADEEDATKALLLAEVKKSNMMYLENLRLKTRLQDFGAVTYTSHSTW